MTTFTIRHDTSRIAGTDATLLLLAFGEPATNDAIVREADRRMRELKDESLRGGMLVLLDGPASLAAVAVIVHHVAHLFGALGVFDPKLNGYVVAVSHDPAFVVGDVLPVTEEMR
jgi:CRISPR-associated protein Csx3